MSKWPGTKANTREVRVTIAGETETPLAEAMRERRKLHRRLARLEGRDTDTEDTEGTGSGLYEAARNVCDYLRAWDTQGDPLDRRQAVLWGRKLDEALARLDR